VAQEQGNAALESAYGKAQRQPGEELLVNLQGRVAMGLRLKAKGSTPRWWSSGSLASGRGDLSA
jgi:hypothetical protein